MVKYAVQQGSLNPNNDLHCQIQTQGTLCFKKRETDTFQNKDES